MQQQMIVTLTMKDDGQMGITLEFEPSLINNSESEKFANLSDDEKMLQNYANHIGSAVIEAVKA